MTVHKLQQPQHDQNTHPKSGISAHHIATQPAKDTPEQKMVGMLTVKQREVKVKNYLLKKLKRNSKNNVRYKCRQNLAKQRFRFQGRFVKLEDLPKHGNGLIIDINGKKLLKPIFKVDRVPKKHIQSITNRSKLPLSN